MDETEPPTNIPEYSVSELAGAVKCTVEGAFGRLRVRGEITEYRSYASGHTYFALKDEGAKIRAVIWRSAFARVGLKPENGVEVVATGRLSTYPDRSEYQLVVERLDYAGEGALLARIEALRRKLAAEGLFAEERKRALPVLPRIVGVVTSASGAVFHDIRSTIARRFSRPILLWPVPVQGEGAAERIAAAIGGFSALPAGGPIPRPDVVIVARGGGGLEDLMAFNDEAVVRAAAGCTIPLISAVGHETDITLIDFAADRRAPTPTAAAELAVPLRTSLVADLAQKAARLSGAISRSLQEARLKCDRAASGLPDLPALIGATRQRLDDRAERLGLALPALMAAKRAALASLPQPDVRLFVAAPRAGLALSGQRLGAALRAMVRAARANLEGLTARLEASSYAAVLARGFALVTTKRGQPVNRAAAVAPGAELALRFVDGVVSVTAEGAPKQGRLPL